MDNSPKLMANIISDEAGSSFILGHYIDKGSFSKVYSLQCYLTKRQYAGKFIDKEKLQKCGIIHKVWDEIKIHQKLRHANIVQFLTFIEQEHHIIIVLEYCSRYSMVNILHALKTLTTSEAKYFMIQIVSAVEYLHRNLIIHRDLKLGNLFVNKYLQIKLGDFGLAVMLEHNSQKRFSRCGTPNYIAPEVINGGGHSYQVDVWALGCILYTMLEGIPPFQGKNTTTTYNNILRCEYSFSPHIDISACVLISNSLRTNPKCRPTVFELTTYEFFSSNDIQPQPPIFNFEEEEYLTLVKGRITKTKSTNVFIIKEVNSKKCPSNCFVKIVKCLSNVKNWPNSRRLEFCAEANSIKPLVWVNTWMDYTNSYGFAYQLSNRDFGILFNDRTRMLYRIEDHSIHYVQGDGAVLICRKDCIPNNRNIQKKTKILMSCGHYMRQWLIDAHKTVAPEVVTKCRDVPVDVFDWARRDGVVATFLTNGSVQTNFASDHTKIILCGYTNTVTIIESANYMKTLKLATLQNCGCGEVLKHKLLIVLNFLNKFLVKQEYESS